MCVLHCLMMMMMMRMMIPDSAGKNLEESGDLPLEPLKWSFGNSTLLQNPQRTKALKHV